MGFIFKMKIKGSLVIVLSLHCPGWELSATIKQATTHLALTLQAK